MTSHALVESSAVALPPHGRRPPGRSEVVATTAFGLGLATFVAYVYWLQRDLWFWFDDFTWLTSYHDGALLEPAKSHLSVVPGAVVWIVANVFGLEHGYDVLRVVALAGLAGLAVTVWWHVRRRVGASVAAIASIAVLWFAPNHVDVLNPVFVKHTLALLLTIVVADRLERDDPTWRGDAITTLLIALAVGCSTTGLVVFAVVGVHLAGTGTRQQRWWLLLAPGAAWLLWYAIAENTEEQSGLPRAFTPTVREFLRHADDLVRSTFVDLGAGSPAVGFALGVGFVVLSAVSVLRWRTCGRTSIRWVAAAGTFVVLSSAVQNMFVLSLGEPPRYRFVLAVFVLLAACESVRGISIDIRILVAATAVVVASGLLLIDGLQSQHEFMRSALATDAPLLLGAEAAGANADPDREINDATVDLVTVGDYQDLIEHVGSPREFLAGIAFNSRAAAEADGILLDEVPIAVEPGACADSTNVPASGLSVPAGSTVSVQSIDQSVDVFAVRFGSLTFGLRPVVTLDLGDSVLLSLPDDEIPVPWTIKGTSGAVLTLC